MIGAIAYFLDRDGSFRNSFSDGWDRILSKHPIPFYYCIGIQITPFLMHDASASLIFLTWTFGDYRGVQCTFLSWSNHSQMLHVTVVPLCSRCCGFLCTAWFFRVDSTLLFLQRQPRSMSSWVPELLLWLGHPGLPSCFVGGLLCPGGGFHCRVRHPGHCIWFPRCNYGSPKDLAETLSHSDQKRTHKGKNSSVATFIVLNIILSI